MRANAALHHVHHPLTFTPQEVIVDARSVRTAPQSPDQLETVKRHSIQESLQPVRRH
jgi:hypothetical protein